MQSGVREPEGERVSHRKIVVLILLNCGHQKFCADSWNFYERWNYLTPSILPWWESSMTALTPIKLNENIFPSLLLLAISLIPRWANIPMCLERLPALLMTVDLRIVHRQRWFIDILMAFAAFNDVADVIIWIEFIFSSLWYVPCRYQLRESCIVDWFFNIVFLWDNIQECRSYVSRMFRDCEAIPRLW